MSGNSGLFVLLLGVIGVSLIAWPRIAKAQQDPDSQVIAQLRMAGSDLSKPHPIEFFLYVPTREAAERVGSRLRALNFEANVTPAAQGPEWLVLATKLMRPEKAELVRLRKVFGELVAAEKGQYDGWGTPVVK